MDGKGDYSYTTHWSVSIGASRAVVCIWSLVVRIPFGYDWTDKKVLIELIFWLVAAYLNRGSQHNPKSVYKAGFVNLLVYFISQGIFGSEYDYSTGRGHGTAG